ncbi:MAG TPA: helix-turn-helix domain-containing protein [Planctomycetota bacterium]|nr:helix-turn-helix domain-containing protein [Planctomycetota bacterium]
MHIRTATARMTGPPVLDFCEIYQPSPPLARFVECFYRLSYTAENRARLAYHRLPEGQSILNFTIDRGVADGRDADVRRARLLLTGPHESLAECRSGGAVEALVAYLKPGSLPHLFGIDGRDLAGASHPLDVVVGRDGVALTERLAEAACIGQRLALIEAFLLARMVSDRPAMGLDLAIAIDQAVGRARIDDLCARSGYSRRHLERVFLAETGMSMKRYCRAVRVRNALATLATATETAWIDSALASGYYDQSHLINEVRDVTGTTPRHILSTPFAPLTLSFGSIAAWRR